MDHDAERSRSGRTARGLSLLRVMRTIRAFDEAAGAAWHAGKARGSVHEYIGQEAIATGVCANLRRDDYVSSYHRGHGHAIAKGADPVAMMLELFGREGGTCGGKGGSMHIADFSVGMLGANGVVGDGVTIAVGAAKAVQLLGEDKVVVAFFGDGAINRGPVLEALNWAQVYRLPILFCCEDNRYSATTLTSAVTAGLAQDRARAVGMPVEEVDGNDVFAMDATAGALVRAVRAGSGPIFLHATTYRWRGHFAPDKGVYRDADEHARLMADDCVARCEAALGAEGVGAEALDALRRGIEDEMAEAGERAEAAPFPPAAAAFADVQDAGAPA